MDKTDEFLKYLLKKSRKEFTAVKKGDESSSKGICPGNENLACYLDNLLTGTDKENVEEHLTKCDKCLQQVIFLHNLKNEVKEEGFITPPQEVIKKAKDLIPESPIKDLVEVVLSFTKDTINVLKDTGNMLTLRAAESAVRYGKSEKEKDFVHLQKTFKDVKVAIIIERFNENTFEIEVLTSDSSTGSPIDDVRLNLIFNEKELASYLTVNGSTSFKNLHMGKYALVIVRDKDIIGKIQLELETA